MKNYDKIADELFQRRDEYFTAKKKRNSIIKKAVVSTACVAVVAIGAFTVFKSGVFNQNPPQEKIPETTTTTTTASAENEYADAIYESGNQNDSSTTSKEAESKKDTVTTVAVEATTKKNYKKNDVITNFTEGSYSMPCYVAPKNGTFFFSLPVQYAVNKYGNSKKYLVRVDIFKDEWIVSAKERNAEYSRLMKAGCDIKKYNVWTYEGADAKKVYYTQVAGIFTLEQLETLFTGREYGYFFEFLSNGDSSPVETDDVVDGSVFYGKSDAVYN
ncbi:MAG: hypothetical protein MJ147_08695 [Clostridia bacterium]|nr:hypothetical protein [Clostridia bacterium]